MEPSPGEAPDAAAAWATSSRNRRANRGTMNRHLDRSFGNLQPGRELRVRDPVFVWYEAGTERSELDGFPPEAN
jgi:hypothetical protein